MDQLVAQKGQLLPRRISVLAVALIGWTAAILVVPELRSTYPAPRSRLVVEAISVGAAAFAAALAWVRFSLDTTARWLFISLGFAVIAVNQAVFGLIVEPGRIALADPAYLWMTARLGAGVLFVLAAFSSTTLRRHEPARVYAAALLAVLGILAVVQGVVFVSDDALPVLVSGPYDPDISTGAAPGVTSASLILGGLGLVAFCVAAFGTLVRWPADEQISAWLASTFLVAGFAHLHYALVPTIFTSRVSTADVLRLLTSGVLTVALLRDIRRSYAAERERAIALTTAYEAQRERVSSLEELERTKADLLRMLAHELLHPVAAIRTLATGLVNGGDRLSDEQRARATQGILEQSEHLRDLVEHAPELDRLRFDEIRDRQPHRVTEVAEDLRRTFPHLAERLSVNVEPSAEHATVHVDHARLMQVFHNLLSNAERYAPAGTPIVVTVECGGSDVVFHVRDAGPGIPTEASERLFQPFVRLANARGVNGSGVGLHIVRSVVEAHGGRAWIEHANGHGGSIVFSLPAEGVSA